ncbi:L10-interacting MYB domain-containing protein, partial [Ananas comosus]
REKPKVISGRKKIIITDRPSGIWNKEYDRLLINLLLTQISIGGEENILQGGEDFWCNIAAKFNESTSLQYEHKHLFKRFNSYRCDYPIVNRIRHHPKFSWDRQHNKVIATDAEWNEYIKQNPDAELYREKEMPHISLLEILFDKMKVLKLIVSNE